MPQRIHGAQVCCTPSGHEDGEGDNGEHQQVLDDADNEVVEPEYLYPVALPPRAAKAQAGGEVHIDGELEPDELSHDAG